MTFSPLFHAATASSDIVIGPRLGAWTLTSHASTGGVTTEVAEQGWTVGANAGVFFPVGPGSAALGMLFSFANLHVTRACQSVSGLADMLRRRGRRHQHLQPDVRGDAVMANHLLWKAINAFSLPAVKAVLGGAINLSIKQRGGSATSWAATRISNGS